MATEELPGTPTAVLAILVLVVKADAEPAGAVGRVGAVAASRASARNVLDLLVLEFLLLFLHDSSSLFVIRPVKSLCLSLAPWDIKDDTAHMADLSQVPLGLQGQGD